jgi:23S rRNA (adenine2030-N6)-methyltransferase
MLSYRHAFHVGNHADVLKHLVLIQVLKHAAQKDKPFWYIDTHAGAGMYALDKGFALQNTEYDSGISRLWDASDLPVAVADYVALVKKFNPGHVADHSKPKRYPGSPAIAYDLARQANRDQDRLRLFELHPNDCKLLGQAFRELGHAPASKKVMIDMADGFAGIKALLPPPPRRAVVLIDPPYEEKQDYVRVVDMVKDSLQRFSTGTYIVWHPMLSRPEPQKMIDKLKSLPLKNWLHVTLSIQAPSLDGFGMYGSGLFIINPPWNLPEILAQTMPSLVKMLGQDNDAGFTLDYQIT